MSFDINVLSINQREPIHITDQLSFEILNEIDNNDVCKRYYDIWQFMTHINGIWYSFVKSDDGIKNAYLLCDSNFNYNNKDILLPPWINDDYIENLTPFILKDEFRKDFEIILKTLLQKSIDGTIMFLSRYQGGDREIVYGTFSLKYFLNMLDNKKLLFNICYIIKL